MGIDQFNLGNLENQLFRIPDADLTDLVAELERRAQDRDKAPMVERIMTKLRPRLAIMKPVRQATLVRFFAEPFADLLYTTGEPRKPIGRIPRSAIVPCYSVLKHRADPARIARYQEDLDDTESENENALLLLGTGFWRYASGILRKALDEAEKSKDAKQALLGELGDPVNYDALKEIVGVLEVAEPIMTLRNALPAAGLSHVSNTDLEYICTALNTVHKKRPENTEFVVFVILARLSNPAMIVEVMQRAEETGTLADVAAVSHIANEAIVSQSEEKIRSLEEKIQNARSGKDLALQTEAFVKEILGAASAVGSIGSRSQSRQVQRTKSQMADLVRREMLEAQDGKTTSSLAALTDPAGDSDPYTAQTVIEDRIVALRIAERFADELGLEKEVNRRLAELEQSITAQSKALLAAFKRRDFMSLEAGDPERQLYGQVRITELLLGPEPANRLRLDGLRLLLES